MKTITLNTNRAFNSLYIKARAFKKVINNLDYDMDKKVFFFVCQEARYEISEANFNPTTIY